MQPLIEPKIKYKVDLKKELVNLEKHKSVRNLPNKSDKNILIATWNLTNFGMQKRKDDHLKMMAKIIECFDLVAVQELADDLEHFNKLLNFLGTGWDRIFTDCGGNRERLGFIFNKKRVTPVGLYAELVIKGRDRGSIVIENISEEFEDFNRNPVMVNFKVKNFEFTLVNVHLYWESFNLRRLEVKALSKWAKSRVKSKYPPNNDIILIGDFNMPEPEESDEICSELMNNGLAVPKHGTNLLGTNLAGDKHFDELAFFPAQTGSDYSNNMGVFDYDNAIFKDLWDDVDKNKKLKFFQYIRYYIADHRPLWAEFNIN